VPFQPSKSSDTKLCQTSELLQLQRGIAAASAPKLTGIIRRNLLYPLHAWCLQALDEAQSKDLLFWASRYHLFVTWSPDRSHPWDSLPAAGQYVTLEIGVQRGNDDKVRVTSTTNPKRVIAVNCSTLSPLPVLLRDQDGSIRESSAGKGAWGEVVLHTGAAIILTA
jgi:hypothetical protein